MNFSWIVIVVMIVAILLEVLYSSRMKRGWYRFNDGVSNLITGGFDQALSWVPQACVNYLYYHIYLMTKDMYPKIDSSLLVYLLCFVVYDFLYYWSHRFLHRSRIGWSAHQVHHQSEDFNLSVALRQSWIASFLTIPFTLVLSVLGFEIHVFMLCAVVNMVYQFALHTQFIDKMPRVYEAVFNTPSHHRVHHGRNDFCIDKNYGGTLIIWDRIFGTFQKEEDRVIYGTRDELTSWNPIKTQFCPAKNLFRNTIKLPLSVWIKYLFSPPVSEESSTEYIARRKFDTKDTSSKRVIVSISVCVLVPIFFFGLVYLKDASVYSGFIVSIAIVSLIYVCGQILDDKIQSG